MQCSAVNVYINGVWQLYFTKLVSEAQFEPIFSPSIVASGSLEMEYPKQVVSVRTHQNDVAKRWSKSRVVKLFL